MPRVAAGSASSYYRPAALGVVAGNVSGGYRPAALRVVAGNVSFNIDQRHLE